MYYILPLSISGIPLLSPPPHTHTHIPPKRIVLKHFFFLVFNKLHTRTTKYMIHPPTILVPSNRLCALHIYPQGSAIPHRIHFPQLHFEMWKKWKWKRMKHWIRMRERERLNECAAHDCQRESESEQMLFISTLLKLKNRRANTQH